MSYFKNSAKAGIFLSFISAYSFSVEAQRYSIYDNQQYNSIEKELYRPGTNFHTSVKSYRLDQINKITNFDSILYNEIKIPLGKLNFWKRLFHDDVLKWKQQNEDINIVINPLFNIETGKESIDGKNTFVNTRGLFIEGNIGKNFAFYADLYENQGTFPNYIDSFAHTMNVLPGQGKPNRVASRSVFDYSQATGYISYNAGKYFNFQLGHGKNFIGDGYRSLLLSDVPFSYPFFKFTTDFCKVKYQILWASLTHLERKNESIDTRYPVKYGVFHYLDWNIGNRLSLGLFESVIWAAEDSTGHYRGFDWHYANPFVFFRPVEYSAGSPDNVNIGLNTKYIASKWLTFYGQIMFDEFRTSELFAKEQWWANKYGYQLGFKTFDLFGAKHLNIKMEYNRVRPFTYSHGNVLNSYGHYNQSLAHPLGANFSELVSILNYRYKRWFIRGEIMIANYGKDYQDSISYGKEIFKSNDLRFSDYNNTVGQGLKTDLYIMEASLSYLINSRNNFNIAAGIRIRNESNELETNKTNFIWFAVRTSLRNLYYDF